MVFAAFNSVANPFVYAILLPTYRKCVIRTFCPCAVKTKEAAMSRNKKKPKKSPGELDVSVVS